MPPVSPMRYGAPSLNQVLEIVAGLAQQNQRVEEQHTPAAAQPAAPQTGFQGLISGVLGSHIKQRQQARLREDQALSQALAMLNAIPDSEQNTPIKLQLATALINSKPGKKDFFSELFNPEADHSYQAGLLQQIAAKMPNQQEQLEQSGAAPASHVRSVAEQGPGFTPTSQKFEFKDQGKFQMGPVIQTADGLQQVLMDQATGEIKLKPLGQGVTEKQSVQQLKNEGKGGASDPTRRKEQSIARALASNDGIDLDQVTDDDELKEAYLLRARQYIQKYQDAQLNSLQLNVPYKQAKTSEAIANAGRGGVTGNQAAVIARQDRDDVIKAKSELAEAQGEVQRLQKLKDNIWNNWRSKNPSTAPEQLEAEMFNRKSTRGEVEEYRKVTAGLAAAQTKLQAAQERASTVGKSVPRTAGQATRGGQQLDLDAVLRREQSTPSPDNEYLQHDYFIDNESTPPPDRPLRSMARVYGDPKMFLINPAGFGVKAGSLRKGQVISSERGEFLIVAVSGDGSKVLARKR